MEKIQNQKIQIIRQQESDKRERERKKSSQEWQERRRAPATDQTDYQQWQIEQKLKEKK